MRTALAAILVLLAAPAFAGDAEQCASAYEHGQELRLGRKLDAAREAFLLCAKPSCPKVVREDCARWLGEIEATMPGIVVRLRRDGGPFDDARVLVDGVVMAEHADQRVLAVDPGPHTVSVEPRGCAPRETTVKVRTGEQVPVDMAVCQEVPPPQPPPPPPAQTRPLPVGPIIVGSAGVAALASFVVLGAVGISDSNHLKSTCYPNCVQGSVDAANAELLGADVSLIVAVTCFVVAGVWWFVGSARHHTAAAPLVWRF